jgi:uncharacterized protein (DUF934 family)
MIDEKSNRSTLKAFLDADEEEKSNRRALKAFLDADEEEKSNRKALKVFLNADEEEKSNRRALKAFLNADEEEKSINEGIHPPIQQSPLNKPPFPKRKKHFCPSTQQHRLYKTMENVYAAKGRKNNQ